MSNETTPSPSVRKDNKSARMEHSGNTEETKGATGINISQDQMLNLFKTIEDPEKKWDCVINHLELLNAKVNKLDLENEELRNGLASANGKLMFLENQLDRVKTKIGDTEWRQMQNDVVLYNVPEAQGEQPIDIVTDVLVNKLQIRQNLIKNTANPTGPVDIDNVFRLGKKLGPKPRPLVTTFTTQKSKKLVMEHYRSVQKTIQIKITDHFPSEMREKRTAQKESLKKFKDLYRESNTKVKLVKDKLLIGTKIHQEDIKKNPLVSTPTNIPKSESTVSHTDIVEIRGSFPGACNQSNYTRVSQRQPFPTAGSIPKRPPNLCILY